MATLPLIDIRLWRGSDDLSADSNEADLQLSTDAVERTTFTKRSRVYSPGLRGASFTMRGYLDYGDDLSEEWLWTEHGTADLPFGVGFGSDVGDRAYLMRGIPSTLGRPAQVGQMGMFQVTANGSGIVARGIILEPSDTARTATFQGDGVEAAAVAADEYLHGGLWVVAASGTNPTLDVEVESDADADFDGSESTQLTFTQKTAVGYDWQTQAGAITDTYYRVNATIGGTDPSFTFAVLIGIATP